jgi:hypothetical protein
VAALAPRALCIGTSTYRCECRYRSDRRDVLPARRRRNAFVVGRPDGLPRLTFVRRERFFEAWVTIVLSPTVTHDDRFALERVKPEEIAGAVCAEFADLRRERQAPLLRSRVERPLMRNRIVQANRHAHDVLRRTI